MAAIPKAFLSILESKRVNQTSKESVKYTVSVVLIMHVLYMGQRLLKIVWRHFSSSEKPLDKCTMYMVEQPGRSRHFHVVSLRIEATSRMFSKATS